MTGLSLRIPPFPMDQPPSVDKVHQKGRRMKRKEDERGRNDGYRGRGTYVLVLGISIGHFCINTKEPQATEQRRTPGFKSLRAQ